VCEHVRKLRGEQLGREGILTAYYAVVFLVRLVALFTGFFFIYCLLAVDFFFNYVQMAERCSGDGWCGLTFAEVLVYAFFDLSSSLLEQLLRLEDLQIMIK
jgi:hypothetical protein